MYELNQAERLNSTDNPEVVVITGDLAVGSRATVSEFPQHSAYTERLAPRAFPRNLFWIG
jgi:hypothetical protein